MEKKYIEIFGIFCPERDIVLCIAIRSVPKETIEQRHDDQPCRKKIKTKINKRKKKKNDIESDMLRNFRFNA